MKILLTGATGYIGKRLLPALVSEGHRIVCCVRDKDRFVVPASFRSAVEVIEVDFLEPETLSAIPRDVEAAYYLMHSMSTSSDYQELELSCALNFREAMADTAVQQVIYLTGIVNEDHLSEHLASRKAVEDALSAGGYHLTALRAGIIIGSGSASFEIIRDLVEKLPVMVTPKWLRTLCQPIGIADVIGFLCASLGRSETYDRDFDIGGPDIMSYKEVLMGYAAERGLRRKIWIVPVMTPRLSSYWLYFVTSTSYNLAQALVDSMKVEVVARNADLNEILGIEPRDYREALRRTLQKVDANEIVSSWKDSMVSGTMSINLSEFVKVPTFGCFRDEQVVDVDDRGESLDRIWRIGGFTGWYYATWLWRIRGIMDKMVGGVGLRRGRTHTDKLAAGDAVDFWRVLFADKEEGRLLLFAEMKLPGEAWLEFKVEEGKLMQTATFRPKGLWGRIYWFGVLPFHGFIFGGMARRLAGRA